MIVLLAGLPGTGKSTVARALANALRAVVIDKDRVRAALFPSDRISYTSEQDDFCQTIMLETARYLLHQRPEEVVVLDGRTFSRTYQIEAVRQFVAEVRTPLKIIECVCDDETARSRLEHDAVGGTHPATNRSFALYQAIKARFEPILQPKLVISTDDEMQLIIERCVRFLG